jgi:hypothetical protein
MGRVGLKTEKMELFKRLLQKQKKDLALGSIKNSDVVNLCLQLKINCNETNRKRLVNARKKIKLELLVTFLLSSFL